MFARIGFLNRFHIYKATEDTVDAGHLAPPRALKPYLKVRDMK